MHMEPMLESYNDNSLIQATSQIHGNPMLAVMAARAAERLGDRGTVRIVEYGCSGGRNSVIPMKTMAETLFARTPGVQVECVLEDLPSNPWNLVMEESAALVSAFPDRVRVLCAGTSFYDPVCADESVDLAYSYVAAHFLSDAPSLASHVMMHEGTADERRTWAALAARDWERFLERRARELRKGATIMISTMSRDGDGYSWREFSELVCESLRQAERSGDLSQHEVEALCIPACLRSEADLVAPFSASSELASKFHVDALHFQRTEIAGERTMPVAALSALLRRRSESVWGGVFLKQLAQLGRPSDSARAVMTDVWNRFEQALARDPAQGWLDMRSCYLQLTRT